MKKHLATILVLLLPVVFSQAFFSPLAFNIHPEVLVDGGTSDYTIWGLKGNVSKIEVRRNSLLESIYSFENNTLQEILRYKSDGESVAFRQVKSYDKTGNLIKDTLYDSNNRVLESTIRQFDQQGLIEIIKQTPSQSERKTFSYSQDSVTITTFSKDKPFYRNIWTFDSRGAMKTWKTQRATKAQNEWQTTGETKFKVDAEGRVIEQVNYEANGVTNSISLFQYDLAGNIIQWAATSSKYPFSYSYSYEFDNQGNWIKRLEYLEIDGQKTLDGEVERKITYQQ